MNDEKMMHFAARKAKRDLEEHKRKILLHHKWDFIKEKKQEFI